MNEYITTPKNFRFLHCCLNMNKAILELSYLPNVVWFKNYLKHEIILVEQEENFVKSTFRNRCEIAGANGKQKLSIPILGGRDHHQLYKNVKIDNRVPWQKIHWQSIRSAYGSTPFFEFYAERFQPYYEKEFEFLFEFNHELLKTVLKILKTDKSFELTSVFEKKPEGTLDLRGKKAVESSKRYYQPFEERNGFQKNLSVIDVIFNLGPQAKEYLLTN